MNYSQTIRNVFKRPLYLVIAILVTATVLLLAIWLPNGHFILETVTSNRLALNDKVTILIASLGAIETNFTFTSRWITIAVSALTGINLSLLAYHIKQKIRMGMLYGSGMLGTLAGLIGIGCASCGSVLLSSVFGVTAASSFIGILPFKGIEFGLFGVFVLLWANKLLLEKIERPDACPVKRQYDLKNRP